MRAWLFTIAAAVALGCGSETGAAGEADGGGTADAGTPDMTSEPDAPPPPPPFQGIVALSEVDMMSMGMWMPSAGADFYRPKDFTVPTPIATFGSCAVYEGASAGGNGGETLNAGMIEVTGGDLDVTLEFGGAGYDSDVPATADTIFSDGDAIHVEAVGGEDIPAFSGDVVAPTEIDVDEPCMSCGLDVDREMGFYIAWEPTEGTDIFLQLAAGDVGIACSAFDTDGELFVPPEATDYLPATSDGGMLMFTRTSRAQVLAKDVAMVSLEAATTKCSMGAVR